MIRVEREGDVRVLQMDAEENRFHPDWMAEVGAALDEVENTEGPVALVTTGAGKFYSNGLDLDYMMGEGAEDAGGYVRDVLDLIGRVLTFPAMTVAAIAASPRASPLSIRRIFFTVASPRPSGSGHRS